MAVICLGFNVLRIKDIICVKKIDICISTKIPGSGTHNKI